jgi:hypothetical protein
MAYEPSLKVVHALLHPETRKALSLPLAALITGALSQVETTIELANRVCDSVFHRSIKTTTDLASGYRVAPMSHGLRRTDQMR